MARHRQVIVEHWEKCLKENEALREQRDELLEALEALVEWAEIDDALPEGAFHERYTKARAAIAKARGQGG